MNHLELFNKYKNILFNVAYRMLSSVMDSEDILQETYLKWQSINLEEIKSHKSYLITIVTRLCIDYLNSSKNKREEYIGIYLPEPLITDNYEAPEYIIEKKESVSTAFLLLMEKLSPYERAVFILHELFDYSYLEISKIIEKSETNCRQILHRANEHISKDKKRFNTTKEQQINIITKFFDACNKADLEGLINLLSNEIVLVSDGGGKAIAVKYPLVGAEKVAKFFIGLRQKSPSDYNIKIREINNNIAFIGYSNNKIINVVVLEINDNLVSSFYIIVNPDKLNNIR
ncbi:MAG: RNA polymerase sigma-70 factor [Candidatus Sericytochromatia bacterium]